MAFKASSFAASMSALAWFTVVWTSDSTCWACWTAASISAFALSTWLDNSLKPAAASPIAAN